MQRTTSILALLAFTANAHAWEYQTKPRPCDEGIEHTPSADVEYQEELTPDGLAVRKADTTSREIQVEFPVQIPVTNYLDPESYNVDLSETELNAAQVKIEGGDAYVTLPDGIEPEKEDSGCASEDEAQKPEATDHDK